MPAVIFYSQYDLYKRWLSCMRITLMPMIVMIVSTFLHVLLCFIFIQVLDTGVVGLAYASTLKDFFLMISVRIYGACSS